MASVRNILDNYNKQQDTDAYNKQKESSSSQKTGKTSTSSSNVKHNSVAGVSNDTTSGYQYESKSNKTTVRKLLNNYEKGKIDIDTSGYQGIESRKVEVGKDAYQHAIELVRANSGANAGKDNTTSTSFLDRFKSPTDKEGNTGYDRFSGHAKDTTLRKLYTAKTGEKDETTSEYLEKQQKLVDSYDSDVQSLAEEYNKVKKEYENQSAIDTANAANGFYGSTNTTDYSKQLKEIKSKLTAKGLSDDEIDQLAEAESWVYNASQRAEQKKSLESTTESTAGNIGAHALDVAVNSVAAIPAAVQIAADKVTGKRTDPNANAFAITNFQNDLEEGQQEKNSAYWQEKTGKEDSWQEKAANFGYNVGMSTSKSLAAAIEGGGFASALGLSGTAATVVGNMVTLPSFGEQAFTSTYNDAKERGLDDDRAMETALVSGLAEMGTEIVSLDKVWDVYAKSGSKAAKNLIVNGLAQAGIEGSEEAANDLINQIADLAINGNQSEYATNVNKYMEQGASQEEAEHQASKDFWGQTFEDFLAGAASGGIMGAGATIAGAHNNNRTGKDIRGNEESYAYAISDDRNDYESDADYKQAQQAVLDVIDSEGKEMSGRDTYKLGKEVNEALQNQTSTIENNYNRAINESDKRGAMTEVRTATTPEELADVEDRINNSYLAEDSDLQEAVKNQTTRMVAAGVSNEEFDNAKANTYSAIQSKIDSGDITMDNIESTVPEDKREWTAAAIDKKQLNDVKEMSVTDAMTARTDGKTHKLTNQVVKDNDSYYIKAEDGTLVSMESGSFNDRGKLFYMGTNRAPGVIDLQEPELMSLAIDLKQTSNIPATSITSAIQTANTMGRTSSRSFEDAMKANSTLRMYSEYLGEEAMKKAYNLNHEEVKAADKQKADKHVKKGESKTTTAFNEASNNNDGIALVADMIARKTGVTIDAKAITNEQGEEDIATRAYISGDTSTVTINKNMIDEVYDSLYHETFGEFMQKNNAEDMAIIQDKILAYLQDNMNAKEYAELVDSYQRAYTSGSSSEIDANKSKREAADEMVNDTMFALFATKEGMNDLIDWSANNMAESERQGFLSAMKSVLDIIIDSVKNFLKTGSFNKAQRTMLEMEEKQAKELRQMVLDAMDVAIENRDAAVKIQSESTESNFARSSKRPKEQSKLKQDITAVMNGKYSGKYVLFGETPAIYRNMLGIRDIPLVMTSSHVFSVAVSEQKAKGDTRYNPNNHYHNLGAETLSQVPLAMKNPAMILKSTTDLNDSRFVALIELFDKNNRPIIAAVQVEGTRFENSGNSSANIIVSSYGRNNFERYVNKAISENRILYVNKTKSQEVYKSARSQCPRILLTSGFDNNLKSFKQIVNSKIPDNIRKSIKVEDSEGRKLTEAQQEYFKNSRVVDENGDLQVVYHGTIREFYEFDRSQGNPEGNFGTGIYFTNDMGDVDENYANENGADLTQKIQLEAEMLEGSEEFEDMDIDEIVEVLKEKYITSDEPITMECYLNIDNPCYVDSTMLLADIEDYLGETIEDFEDEDEYYYALEEKTAEVIDDILSDITDSIELYSGTDEISAVLSEAAMEGGIAVEDLRSRLDELYLEDDQGRMVSSEVLRQIIESLGYDGIIDNTVSEKFKNMNLDDDTVHYIVFNSNQAKFVSNENPTDNPDVRKSIKVADARNSFKTYGEASPYTDSLEEVHVITTMLSSANNALGGIKSIKKSSLDRVARNVIKKYASNVDAEELSGNILQVFNLMSNNQLDMDYETVMDFMLNIGDEVINNSQLKDPESEKIYNAAKDNLKKYNIKLTEADKAELKNTYGTLIKGMGTLKKYGISIAKNGQTIDSLYTQIQDEMRNITGVQMEDVSPADELLEIIDTMESIEPTAYLWEGANDLDKSLSVVADIVDGYYTEVAKTYNKDAEKSALFNAKKSLNKQFEKYKATKEQAYEDKINSLIAQLDERNQAGWQPYMDDWEDFNLKVMTEKEIKATAKQRADKQINSYKESQEKAKQINNIRSTGNRMIKWLTQPTDKQHVPDFLRKPLGDFLSSIDFVGKADAKAAVEWKAKMESLKALMQKVERAERTGEDSIEAYFAQGTIASELVDRMESFIKTYGANKKLQNLDAKGLKELSEMMSSISAAINSMNTTYANSVFEDRAELARQTVEDISKLKKRKDHTKLGNTALDFLSLEEAEPIRYFEHLGGAAKSVFDELRQGFDTRTARIKQASEYMEQFKKDHDINVKDMAKWEKQSQTFNLQEGKVTLTIPQIMSLYELSKREQAKAHIVLGGIKAGDIELEGTKIKQIKKLHHQSKSVHIHYNELMSIIDTLTDEQKAMADGMQQYMATECSKWGNNVTKKMFGYSKFTEEDYFPIRTDSMSRGVNAATDNIPTYYSIKNQGFTKAVKPSSNNALVLDDIFDVFTKHVVGMANYEGYALAISDAMRWFNYSEVIQNATVEEGDTIGVRRDTLNNVQEAIDEVYGKHGGEYFRQFIKDINGDYAGTGGEIGLLNRMMGNYKAQAVMANLRVVVQQPTAIVRAAEQIESKYLLKAQKAAKDATKFAEKAQENSPIAYWKAQGYYETLIGKSMKGIITGENTLRDKINDAAGWAAGKADDLTWGIMYRAAELKVQDEQPNLKYDSKEFIAETVKLFDSIIDHTQVVDTIFHKSEFMRNQSAEHKMLSAFMAEPTKTYNMLAAAWSDVWQAEDKDTRQEALNKAGHIAKIFLAEQALNAIITGLVDTARDDDKDGWGLDVYLDHLKENLLDNLKVYNLLPLFKEIESILEGYDTTNYQMESLSSAIGTIQKMVKWATEDDTTPVYGKLYTVAEGVSQVFGMPFATALREVKTLHNNINDIWNGKDWYKTSKAETAADKTRSYNEAVDIYDSNDLTKIKTHLKEVYDEALESEEATEGDGYTAMRADLKKQFQRQYDPEGSARTAVINRYKTLLKQTKKSDGKGGYRALSDKEIENLINGWIESQDSAE